MVIDENAKEQLLEQLVRTQQASDDEALREEFLLWLEQIPFPGGSESGKWDACLKTFPRFDDESESLPPRQVRFALALHTATNRYIVAVIENSESSSTQEYAVCVYVDWKKDEWHRQKALDTVYRGTFDDHPRPRHIIWAQNFRPGELGEALNASAIAILGHELVGAPATTLDGELIKDLHLTVVDFPSRDQDD